MSNGPAVVVRRQGSSVISTNSQSISTQGAYNGGGAQNSYLLTSTINNKFNSKPGNGYNRPSTSSYQPSMYRSSRNMQNSSSQLKNTVNNNLSNSNMIINSSLYSSGMTNLNSAIPVAQPKSLIISNSGTYTLNNKPRSILNSSNIIASQQHGNQAWFWGTNASAAAATVTPSVSHVAHDNVPLTRPMSSPLSSLTTAVTSSPSQNTINNKMSNNNIQSLTPIVTEKKERKSVRFADNIIAPPSPSAAGVNNVGLRGIQNLTAGILKDSNKKSLRPSLSDQLAAIGSKAEAITADIRAKNGLDSENIPAHTGVDPSLLFTLPARQFNVGTLQCRYPSPVRFYNDRCEYSFAHPYQSLEIQMIMYYKDMTNASLGNDNFKFKLAKKLVNFPSDYDPSNLSHVICIQLVSTLASSIIRQRILPLIKQ